MEKLNSLKIKYCMKKIKQCPICACDTAHLLYPDYKGRCVTSQLAYFDNISLENCCCTQCGFIYNAAGFRGIEETLYNVEAWKPKPQVKSFKTDVKSQQERALEIFKNLVTLPESGTILDFGAGTGAFLRAFHEDFPMWEMTAIEPGAGYAMFADQLPLKQSYNAPFYTLDIPECFDAIVVMSVLEHIANPLEALLWIRKRLAPGGILLMQHPNFAKLPGDLFCADHLNKLTIPYMRALCAHARLEPVAHSDHNTLFAFACRHTHSEAPLPSLAIENLRIARQCEDFAKNTVEAVSQAVESARMSKGKVAIFGTSPVGNMSIYMLDCKADIACFVDENSNVWGIKDDIPVIGPQDMQSLGVTDIALAISPVYWDIVAQKMKAFDVRVHIPKLPNSYQMEKNIDIS